MLGEVARDVQFIERLRSIRASPFVWSSARFGSGIPGFAEARHWYERLGGARLWPRPFQMRFKRRLRALLPRDKKIGRTWDLDVVVWPKTMARSRQSVRVRLVIVPGPDGGQR